MNNEEKKAIESIKNLIYGNYDSIILKDEEGYTLWNEDFETILNLIEKQQKEIEEYKTLFKKQKELEEEKDNLIKQGWLNE